MPGSVAQATGRGLAKVLGIQLADPKDGYDDNVTRGESILSIETSNTFVEGAPTSAEWLP